MPGKHIYRFFNLYFYFIVIILLLEESPFKSLEYQLYDTISPSATVAQHPEWQLVAHFALIMNTVIWIQNIFISGAILKCSLTFMVYPSCLSCTNLSSEQLSFKMAFLFQGEENPVSDYPTLCSVEGLYSVFLTWYSNKLFRFMKYIR